MKCLDSLEPLLYPGVVHEDAKGPWGQNVVVPSFPRPARGIREKSCLGVGRSCQAVGWIPVGRNSWSLYVKVV